MQKDGRYFKLVKLQMEGEHYSTTPQLVKKETTDDAKQPAQQIEKPGDVGEIRNKNNQIRARLLATDDLKFLVVWMYRSCSCRIAISSVGNCICCNMKMINDSDFDTSYAKQRYKTSILAPLVAKKIKHEEEATSVTRAKIEIKCHERARNYMPCSLFTAKIGISKKDDS
mmetsp:Transcript_5892/g.7883  ORF Transcript_5892/g.7883 Transcript_5892/m.7883 type:complete len:170 (-) Transcript_5892:153-662(-)